MKKNKRNRAYRLYQRKRAILRKKGVSRRVYGTDWFLVDGKYSKGHIGCGCGLCKPDKRFQRPSWEDAKKTTRCIQDIVDYWSGEE